MGKTWIFAISAENWPHLKASEKFATQRESAANKMSVGDRVLIYISKTHSVRGAFEVLKPWVERTTLRNPDEIKAGQPIYPFEFDIKTLAIGVADLRKLKPRLAFMREVKDRRWGRLFQQNPANKGKPIPASDYNLILTELRKNPEPKGPLTPIFRPRKGGETKEHKDLIGSLMLIGEVFGFDTMRTPKVNDLRPKSDRFTKDMKLDVAWRVSLYEYIPFEVQHHGRVPDLMLRLGLVDEASKRSVVVIDSKHHEEIAKASKGYPFSHKLRILTPEEVSSACGDIEALRDLRRKILE